MDNPKYVVNDEDWLGPSFGYLIIEEDFNIALGVFALAGLTDLVSCKGSPLVLLPFLNPSLHYTEIMQLQFAFPLEEILKDAFHLAIFIKACH